MRKLLTLILISFVQFSYSQLKYTGQNPIAVKYTAAHFGLKGKVKSITSFAPDGKTILSIKEFDNLGRLLKDSSEAGLSSAVTYYTYDDIKNKAIVKQLHYKIGKSSLLYYYTFNSEKEVTHQYDNYPDMLTHLYKYEGKLLVLDSNNYNVKKYTYNSDGLLSSEKVLLSQKTFPNSNTKHAYKVEGQTITIDTEVTYEDGKKLNWKNIYKFSNGNLVGETYMVDASITNVVYELDNKGNIVSIKTEKKFIAQEHQKYNTASTSKWVIQYY